jgi:hypothetical protein
MLGESLMLEENTLGNTSVYMALSEVCMSKFPVESPRWKVDPA